MERSENLPATPIQVEDDGETLNVTLRMDGLYLRIAVPWSQIAESVEGEIRAQLAGSEVVFSRIGSPRGLRFALRDLIDEWIDRFDPGVEAALGERKLLLDWLSDSIARIEAATEAPDDAPR